MAQPAITSIIPSTGSASGGTSVLLIGTAFTGATAVNFGSVKAASFSVISDTQVTATTPPGAGDVPVTIATGGGTSAVTAGSEFSYAADSVPAVDPALANQFAGGLLTMLQTAASPDAVQAQNILLRRMALEGDVIPSRVQAPDNISKIGGYINLLTSLNQTEMLSQALAGILGVAGPNPSPGWAPSVPLTMVPLSNDRPSGPAQKSIPLTFYVRSDFVSAVQAALSFLHDRGCTLPASSVPAMRLPPAAPGVSAPSDVLPYIGRTLDLATAAALSDPATDPLLLVRAQGSSDPFTVAANVMSAASVAVTPGNYDAVKCTPSSCSTVALTNQSLVQVEPVLAQAGFYTADPIAQPANSVDARWAHFTNITGLVTGTTRLGDELALLYDPSTIAGSVFAASLDWVWNGTGFAPAQ